MSDQTLLRERLQMILDALERIPRRFEKIKTPDDFVTNSRWSSEVTGSM